MTTKLHKQSQNRLCASTEMTKTRGMAIVNRTAVAGYTTVFGFNEIAGKLNVIEISPSLNIVYAFSDVTFCCI